MDTDEKTMKYLYICKNHQPDTGRPWGLFISDEPVEWNWNGFHWSSPEWHFTQTSDATSRFLMWHYGIREKELMYDLLLRLDLVDGEIKTWTKRYGGATKTPKSEAQQLLDDNIPDTYWLHKVARFLLQREIGREKKSDVL